MNLAQKYNVSLCQHNQKMFLANYIKNKIRGVRWGILPFMKTELKKCLNSNCSRKNCSKIVNKLFGIKKDLELCKNRLVSFVLNTIEAKCQNSCCGGICSLNILAPKNDKKQDSNTLSTQTCIKSCRHIFSQTVNNISQDFFNSRQIIFDQKTKPKEKNMMLNSSTNQQEYLLISCFTGFGTSSIIYLNKYLAIKPKMTECENLFPDGSEFGLDKLQKAVTDYNAKKK